MSLMNIARIAKVVALLAFVLPWVAVSCSIPGQGTVDLATASGIELIQGKMTANKDAERQMTQGMGSMFGPNSVNSGSMNSSGSTQMDQMPELGLNVFGIAAAAVILIGLGLSFAGQGKTAARNTAIASLVGAALVFGTVWWWKDQMKKQDSLGGGGAEASSPFGGGSRNPLGGGMNAMGAQAVDGMLQERFGYWIALSALFVAAGAAGLGMAGGVPASRPDDAPPAA